MACTAQQPVGTHLAVFSAVTDATCDQLSRMGLLVGSLLHWFTAAMMLRDNLFPVVLDWTSPARTPLLAMVDAAVWLGLR